MGRIAMRAIDAATATKAAVAAMEKAKEIGITQYSRFIVFGGYPITGDRQLIGSIGISGGYYSQDMECARAALETVGSPVPD